MGAFILSLSVALLMTQQAVGSQERVAQISCKDLPSMLRPLEASLNAISESLERQTSLVVDKGLLEITEDERALVVFEFDTVRSAVNRVIDNSIYKDPDGQVRQVLRDGFLFDLIYQPFGQELTETRRTNLNLRPMGATYTFDLVLQEGAPLKSFFVNGTAIPLLKDEAGNPSLEGIMMALNNYSDLTDALPRQNFDGLSITLESKSPLYIRAAAGLFSENVLDQKIDTASISYDSISVKSAEDSYAAIYPLLYSRIQVQELRNELIQLQNICQSE
jgi:hypothetical protein